MAVKGKGKQVAAESPGPGAGGKRRKGSGDAEAGPSSSSAAKRRRRAGVLQFVDDAVGVDDDYEEDEVLQSEEEASDPDNGFFTGGEHVQNLSHKRTERSHPLPFLVKEEELSGDELEEFIRNRYSNGVKYAADRSYSREDDDIFPMDGALKEPTIWRVKCMVGRERQMAFCFMQKFVDLQKIGTKVPIITAFALDHVRGFVFVEAEKACDVTEACKGFCSVYASRITSVPAAEVPSLLSSRTKPFEISRGTWVRMKNGNYKGDLAQVVSVDNGRKRVMIKIIPRVDLHAISKKYGGAISLKGAAVPAPRLISSQELEFFRPHIEMKRDRQTGEVFEVLDGLMFKDGFLYKRVALSSLIYWGIQPTETELLKFSSSPINRASADDLDWVSSIYGPKKRNIPAEPDIKSSSSSKMKSSKTSKASTSTEDFDDNDEFNLHDLVLFGRKDFGVIIAIEKDGFRILKGGPEGSAVTVKKNDIKKSCVDKMFTAVDRQNKIVSINDTVNVLEGPFQGKQGVVKHLYMGILFIYNESESENCGFFCAQCGSCGNVKKRKDLGGFTTENLDNPFPMFAEPPYEQNEHRGTERPNRSTREQLFSIGQMLRIRKGPLKGYLCRVVRIFRNDVTVKLDSLLKIVTVQAEFLSVPANRGDNLSGAPAGNFGSQDTSFFGSEAEKTSWDNGLPSFVSDSWQPFSSSTLPVQNAGGESENDPWSKKSSAEGESDPWGKKTDGDPDPWGNKVAHSADGDSDPWGNKVAPSADGDSDLWGNKVAPSADGDSDPWGKKVVTPAHGDSDAWGKKTTSSAVGVWNAGAAQKESSSDNAWGKQAAVGGSDAAGSSWDGTAANKESEKSDNWGEACRVVDMGTGADADPWGSKVKAIDTEGTDSWEKATMPPDNKLEGVSQGWGRPLGKSNEDQGKDNISKDAGNNGAWDTPLPATEDGTWGKSKDNNGDGAGAWNEARSSDKNGGAGGWDTSAANWNKSSAVGEAQEEGWGKGKGASDQAGCGDWDKPKSFGNDGSSRWNKGEETRADDQNNSWSKPGNFGGGRGFGRGRGRGRGQECGDFDGRNDQGSWKSSWGGESSGRTSWRSDSKVDNEVGDSSGYRGRGRGGRGQYGGRGRGRDNGWRNGDRSDSGFGRENDSADGQNWGNRGSSYWDKDSSNKGSWAGGDNWNATNPPSNQPWSSSGVTKSFGENKPSTWNSSKDNKPSVGEQDDPWASKVASIEGKEQQNDTWASKMTSAGAEDNSGGWNTRAKDSCTDGGEERQNDPWANKAGTNKDKEQETDPWTSKVPSSAGSENNNSSWNTTAKDTPSEEKAGDPWSSKGGNDNIKKTDSWGAGSSGGNQESSWSKPNFSLGDQAWSKPRFGDNGGNSRGGFGRGYRGRGRGRNFGDGGSSWNGGNKNDESGGERSEEPWSRRDLDGGRGRGRGRFGRGDRSQGSSNFGSGDGGSWGSGRGNGDHGGYRNWNGNNEQRSFGQGGGWSSDWNGSKGSGEGGQAFAKSKPSWEAQNTSGGDDQAGNSDANKSWSRNRSSPSILGQPSSDANKSSTWGATSCGAGGGGSWGKSNEDSWNSSGGGAAEKSSWGGGSEAPPKKDDDGPWGKDGEGKSNEDSWNSSGGAAEKSSWVGGSEAPPKKDDDGPWGSGSRGGGGSSWDKAADGAWNGSKGGSAGSGGW
ncbi:protein RNA-directed DNA methylation 3 [Panicum miliaceum]|uniref:Protein RNA-directed DNA methylation 3 n=1 Tax=Panicum miliaceum TaxID=4540 RepID=A0A3L6RBU5_PANMI|nr:protein RNA-directed DNA methylation 3 [Panicum miliaceum]